MRHVSPVEQIKPHEGIAWIKQSIIRNQIGRAAGVRLHVGVSSAEQAFGSVTGEIFDRVNIFAAAIITHAGVAFGVFVGQARTQRL